MLSFTLKGEYTITITADVATLSPQPEAADLLVGVERIAEFWPRGEAHFSGI